ncbi:MAG: aspartate ammonia-lyase [Spirochaetaceae bacterium]|nr:aspartate ammonia-lyase [Spirochaetaceae bacterium]|tara:strand:+ start:40384 stop:42240 length:1857 start_codon:yes stop_codon:yes gene_type:complete
MEINAATLKQVELFSALPEPERQTLAGHFQLCEFEKGDYLFKQGEDRHALFFIQEGEIDLIDESLGLEKVYVTSGPGTILGEPILIEEGKHALGGRARSQGRYGKLDVGTIRKIKLEDPHLFGELVLSLSKVLARRLAYANRGNRGISADFRTGESRMEHDLIGDREVPHNVLWGIQTLRAMENFSISGVRLDHFPEFIESLADIKAACAVANHSLGNLDEEKKTAIIQACDELCRGMWHSHFMVDMIQGGAGTSTNMNANEVITNRALMIMGKDRGDYKSLHPNNHVNMSQSTNDVYPSSIKVTLLRMMDRLLAEVRSLSDSFADKGVEFKDIIKMGRTQLQDAVPMTLGQEFQAWSLMIRDGAERIELARKPLSQLNMGGTAIGTGINTHPEYTAKVITELSRRTGLQLTSSLDLVQGTQDTSGFVELAGVLKMLAVRLSKICNDLRLLSSGPRCGLNEINLPAVQPGSSIMPGKVNPVIPEVVNQVAFQVIALDNAVALASEGGQLELNVFEPIIAYDLFTSIEMLANAVSTLRSRCIEGITANPEVCRRMVNNSIGIVTALNPHLGYEKTSALAREALETGRSLGELVLEKGYMTQEKLDEVLSPENMIRPSLK